MDLPLYRYQPISPSQIRVLELKSNSTACMRHVELKKPSKSTRYTALSYTWGTDTETFPFQCDDRNLPVRKNLLGALSHLNDIVTTPIWIDAICINQSNEQEKMCQIRMMTDIYKNAQKVLVSILFPASEPK